MSSTYLEHELRDLDRVGGRAVASREKVCWPFGRVRDMVLLDVSVFCTRQRIERVGGFSVSSRSYGTDTSHLT